MTWAPRDRFAMPSCNPMAQVQNAEFDLSDARLFVDVMDLVRCGMTPACYASSAFQNRKRTAAVYAARLIWC